MYVVLNERTHHRRVEGCQMVTVSNNGLLVQLREGMLSGAEYRDRLGRRLFGLGLLKTFRASRFSLRPSAIKRMHR